MPAQKVKSFFFVYLDLHTEELPPRRYSDTPLGASVTLSFFQVRLLARSIAASCLRSHGRVPRLLLRTALRCLAGIRGPMQSP